MHIVSVKFITPGGNDQVFMTIIIYICPYRINIFIQTVTKKIWLKHLFERSTWLLKEKFGWQRALGSAVVVLGVISLRLA